MSSLQLQSVDVFHSQIIYEPLSCSQDEIENFLVLLNSCMGPNGKLKIIQNSSGGHVTITSSSSKLFPLMSLKNMFLKLAISSAISHLSAFSNCGLYCSVFSLCILKNGIKSELPPCLFGELIHHFGKSFSRFLISSETNCHHVLQLSGLSELSNIIHTLISSKPGCVLTHNQKCKLSMLLLEAFLNSLPTSGNSCVFENISYYIEEGFNPEESKLFKGILVKFPDIYKKWENQYQNASSNKDILVALFCMSLAGDVEFSSNQIVAQNVSVWQEVLEHMKSLVYKLVFDGVKIVFCQKVIHPSLRKLLELENILVLDRLGFQVAQDIEHVTGAVPVASLCDIKNITYGLLTSVQVIAVGTKKYFNFQNENQQCHTLYICHYNEEALNETVFVCKQVIKTLYRLLKDPALCCGAGCTEIHVAQLVKKEVLGNLSVLAKRYNCSTGLIVKMLEVFLSSVYDVALAINQGSRLEFVTETVYSHLWKLKSENCFPSSDDTCLCGQFMACGISSEDWCFLERTVDVSYSTQSVVTSTISPKFPLIVDELRSKASAAAVAFETACSLLKIGLCISSTT